MKWLSLLILFPLLASAQTTLFVTSNPPATNGPCYIATNEISVATNYVLHVYNSLPMICPDNPLCLTSMFALVDSNNREMFVYGELPKILAGPIKVRLYGCGMITYKIAPKEEPIQPGTGVVIPSDATGPVEIIMESSADLVNWNPSVPGIYGANTTNRFFRLRAVRH